MRKYTIAGLLAIVAFLSPADEGYQYIVSGYPVANPSRSLASGGMPLATGRYTCRSEASPLEARYRTFLESNAGKLLSTPFLGLHLIVR